MTGRLSGGVCFVFMSRVTVTILLIAVEGTPGAATWQKTLFSLHQLRPRPPNPLLLLSSVLFTAFLLTKGYEA